MTRRSSGTTSGRPKVYGTEVSNNSLVTVTASAPDVTVNEDISIETTITNNAGVILFDQDQCDTVGPTGAPIQGYDIRITGEILEEPEGDGGKLTLGSTGLPGLPQENPETESTVLCVGQGGVRQVSEWGIPPQSVGGRVVVEFRIEGANSGNSLGSTRVEFNVESDLDGGQDGTDDSDDSFDGGTKPPADDGSTDDGSTDDGTNTSTESMAVVSNTGNVYGYRIPYAGGSVQPGNGLSGSDRVTSESIIGETGDGEDQYVIDTSATLNVNSAVIPEGVTIYRNGNPVASGPRNWTPPTDGGGDSPDEQQSLSAWWQQRSQGEKVAIALGGAGLLSVVAQR